MRRVNECMCIGAWQIKSTRIIFSDFGFFSFRFFSIIATRSTSVMIWFSVVLCLCSPLQRVCVRLLLMNSLSSLLLRQQYIEFFQFVCNDTTACVLRCTEYNTQCTVHSDRLEDENKNATNEKRKKKNIGIEIDTHSNVSRIEWTTLHNE